MLREEDIAVTLKCQQFECNTYLRDAEEKESVFLFESKQETELVKCPHCGGPVYIDGYADKWLKDIPVWYDMKQDVQFVCHRYECRTCKKKFTEEIPVQHPGTRITERAAKWIQGMLQHKISIHSIQEITGIHWGTIRKLHGEIIAKTLEEHLQELKESNYHPRFLAVDEFAIHKGHTYATCVMDLESGEVLWVGKGRSEADFKKFFEEIEPTFLTKVMAVAMDMNASYHKLVTEHLPSACVVYDRYHMQAQYGKDVLGVVRLAEARAHKERSEAIKAQMSSAEQSKREELKAEAKSEKRKYSKIKKLRWTLLKNGANLSEAGRNNLEEILTEHADLAVCYAMKEEMCRLFRLTDLQEAETGWKQWFAGAKASGIPALVKFAELKEKRIDGLIAHAIYPISTGKLEGFNNKIKVTKRIAYGYRDDDYFFSLVKYISLSGSVLPGFPKFS